ncbi:hypothetical protein HYQ44_001331 [Verticillium longisporum]|nr:hypothetical protein HYQ44_001331 [Verticillium longisporum]
MSACAGDICAPRRSCHEWRLRVDLSSLEVRVRSSYQKLRRELKGATKDRQHKGGNMTQSRKYSNLGTVRAGALYPTARSKGLIDEFFQ